MSQTHHLNRFEDQIALRELMAKYTDAVNRHDGTAWISCWAEHAQWDLMGIKVSGKSNILALWKQMMSGFEFVLMMPSSGLMTVSGDTATGHWYLQEYTRDKQGRASTVLSRYVDSYCKENSQWCFQSRQYQTMYNGDANLTGQYMPIVQTG